MQSRLKIFFDGGCQPNPGPMETGVVARGVFYHEHGLGHGTNNDAEWLALLHALRVAALLNVHDYILLGDSAVVINQANGIWRCKSEALQSHLTAFQRVTADQPKPAIRKIARAQNLAGIALEKQRDLERDDI
jgi:ribonuclease HI